MELLPLTQFPTVFVYLSVAFTVSKTEGAGSTSCDPAHNVYQISSQHSAAQNG
jgi:hypothetical protein